MKYLTQPNDANANTKRHALGDVVFVFEEKLYAPLSYLIAKVIQHSDVINGQYRVELLSPGYEKQRRWWSDKYVFEHLPQLLACWKDNNKENEHKESEKGSETRTD